VPAPLRVVVAEDAVLLREGLVGLLERFGHTVTAAVGDAEALQVAVRADPPDVVVTDVRMPPGFTDEGLRAAVALRTDHPTLAASAICSSTGSGGSRSSWTRWPGSPMAERPSIPRSSASCSGGGGTRSPG
jgi:CheY-like chemotaxis protein